MILSLHETTEAAPKDVEYLMKGARTGKLPQEDIEAAARLGNEAALAYVGKSRTEEAGKSLSDIQEGGLEKWFFDVDKSVDKRKFFLGVLSYIESLIELNTSELHFERELGTRVRELLSQEELTPEDENELQQIFDHLTNGFRNEDRPARAMRQLLRAFFAEFKLFQYKDRDDADKGFFLLRTILNNLQLAEKRKMKTVSKEENKSTVEVVHENVKKYVSEALLAYDPEKKSKIEAMAEKWGGAARNIADGPNPDIEYPDHQ